MNGNTKARQQTDKAQSKFKIVLKCLDLEYPCVNKNLIGMLPFIALNLINLTKHDSIIFLHLINGCKMR